MAAREKRKGRHRLPEVAVRNAKPRQRPYKLFDGDGLYLNVHPNGSKYWRLKYRYAGKEKVLALGVYDQVSMTEARARADKARKLLADGFDPVVTKRVERAAIAAQHANTFEKAAEAWMERHAGDWTPSYTEKVRGILSANLYPRIGALPLAALTAPIIIEAVKPIEARGAIEQAARALRWTSAILRCGVANGLITSSPLAGIKPSEVLRKRTAKSHPHLERHELGDFLRALTEYPGKPETRLAVRLLLLTFVRTGELRGTQWAEFDLEHAEWRIPGERMKMGAPHIVPLSRQALALLAELRQYTGYSTYLFPNHGKHPYMSENTINKCIHILGYKGRVVGHGFRATASTILNDSGLFNPDAIEAQLAHKEQNEVRAAYNRAKYLPERRKVIQWWADFLDAAHKGADVVPLKRKRS